jgi:hypothetical protein
MYQEVIRLRSMLTITIPQEILHKIMFIQKYSLFNT